MRGLYTFPVINDALCVAVITIAYVYITNVLSYESLLWNIIAAENLLQSAPASTNKKRCVYITDNTYWRLAQYSRLMPSILLHDIYILGTILSNNIETALITSKAYLGIRKSLQNDSWNTILHISQTCMPFCSFCELCVLYILFGSDHKGGNAPK